MKITKRLLFLLWMFVGASELVAMNIKWKNPESIDPELEKELKPFCAEILGINPVSEVIGRIRQLGTLSYYWPKDYASNSSVLLDNNKAVKYVNNVADKINNMPIYNATVIPKENGRNLERVVIDGRGLERFITKKIRKKETKPLLMKIEILCCENNQLKEEIGVANEQINTLSENIYDLHKEIDIATNQKALEEERKKVTEPFKKGIKNLNESLNNEKSKVAELERQKIIIQSENSKLQNQWNNRSIIEQHPWLFGTAMFLVGGVLVGLIMKHAPQPQYVTI